MDFFWNAHVINYDGIMQKNLISGAIDALNVATTWMSMNARTVILPGIGVVTLGLIVIQIYRGRGTRPKITRRRASIIASGHYGEMLKIFGMQSLQARTLKN